MTFIVALSLILWAVVITVIVIGARQDNEDCTMSGLALLAALILCSFSFQAGAFWQHVDTLEKYQLIKKVAP